MTNKAIKEIFKRYSCVAVYKPRKVCKKSIEEICNSGSRLAEGITIKDLLEAAKGR